MNFNDLTAGAEVARAWLASAGPLWYLGAPAALVALTVLGVLLRRWTRGRTAARLVTTLATVLGLAWSAQGMWDAAVHSYGVAVEVASIIFVVFEAMLISNMLKAHQYRDQLVRRARFVRGVWLIAAVMGLVVAFGEGLGQAPLRLAVPLMVAYNWWLDLTADDDPDAKPATSWRLTPREVGLRLGLLRLTDADVRDATEAERRYLGDRIAVLAFAIEHGAGWTTAIMRRRIRLARLKLDADPALLASVHARLELSRRDLAAAEPEPEPESHPVMPPQPAEPVRVPAPEPTPAAEPVRPSTEERRPQGWHRPLSGQLWVRGADLEDVAVTLMADSVRAGAALTTEQLAAAFEPPLRDRKAQEFRAKGRARAGSLNGHQQDALIPAN